MDTMTFEDEDQKIRDLTALKNINVSALEAQAMALQMTKDGYTTEQIGTALGYSPDVIANLIQQTVVLGSPEEILQEALKRIVSLIPIAEAQYRTKPAATFAYTLTGFIESARTIIDQIHTLKGKEESYRAIVAKVLQPLCREMIKSMMGEVGSLKILTDAGAINEEDLKRFSTSLGKKFQECYRQSTESLGNVLGVSPDVRAKTLGEQSEAIHEKEGIGSVTR